MTNSTKAKKKPKAYKIDKQKDEILLGEDLGVEWLVEVINISIFNTLQEILEFLEGSIEGCKERKWRKDEIKKITKNIKHKKEP